MTRTTRADRVQRIDTRTHIRTVPTAFSEVIALTRLTYLWSVYLELLTRERLAVVFGFGGERNPVNRPLMGGAVSAADLAVVTSGNSPSEYADLTALQTL